jgi:hypothetical protein
MSERSEWRIGGMQGNWWCYLSPGMAFPVLHAAIQRDVQGVTAITGKTVAY